MAGETLSSITTTAAPPDQTVGEDAMRRLGLPVACAWLVLVAGVEFLLSYFLPQVGEPIDVPALVVAASGLGLMLLGYFVAGVLRDRGRVRVPASVRRALAIGAFALPVLSLGWNLGGTGPWVLPAACLVAVLGGLLCLVGVISRRKTRFFFVTVALMTGSIILSVFLGAVPNGLSLKFAFTYEAALNTQVAGAQGTPSFAIPGHAAWYFDYGSAAPVDVCAHHLIGPWWEVANEAPFCPTGFIDVAGP